jgi:hypothetical protein
MMAKIKWDVSGSDPDKAVVKEFVQPKPGTYIAKLVEAPLGYKKNDGVDDKNAPRLEVVYEILGVLKAPKTDGDVVGARLFDYVPLNSEAAAWKLDQFLQAFGQASKKKRKGTLDTDALAGMPCRLRIRGETYEGEYRAKVGGVMAGSDEDLDLAAEQEEVDEEEIEEEPDEVEEEEEVEEEVDEDEAISYSEEELAEFKSVKDLAAICKDLELKPPKEVQKNAAKLRAWIFENQPNPPEGEEPEEEGGEDEEDYSSWDLKALKQEIEDRGLECTPAELKSPAKLRAKLVEDDNDDPFS